MYVITLKNHLWYLKDNRTFPSEASSCNLHYSWIHHALAQAGLDSQSPYLYLPYAEITDLDFKEIWI